MSRLNSPRCLVRLLVVGVAVLDSVTRADEPAPSPTPEERRAAAALAEAGASLRINGQYQITSISLLTADNVTDDTLAHLQSLPHLESLSLSGARLTDAGLKHLEPLKSLRVLSVRDGQFSDEAWAKLEAALPGCNVSRRTSPRGLGASGGFQPNARFPRREGDADAAVRAAELRRVAEAQQRAAELQQAAREANDAARVREEDALQAAKMAANDAAVMELMARQRQADQFAADPRLVEAAALRQARVGALARPPRTRSRFTSSRLLRELQAPDVQIELGISTDQWNVVQVIESDGAAAQQEILREAETDNPPTDDAARAALSEKLEREITQLAAAADERLQALFTADQFLRLQQLAWQTEGATLLFSADFTAEFGLTETQQAQLETVREDQRKMLTLMQSQRRSRESSPPTLEPLRGESWNERLLAVLTEEQRALYETKLGPPRETDDARLAQQAFALLDADGDEQLDDAEWSGEMAVRVLAPARTLMRAGTPLGREEFVRLFAAARQSTQRRAGQPAF